MLTADCWHKVNLYGVSIFTMMTKNVLQTVSALVVAEAYSSSIHSYLYRKDGGDENEMHSTMKCTVLCCMCCRIYIHGH